MAVWQVRFHLVPRGSVARSGPLTPAGLNDTDWWASAAFPVDYQRRLAQVASPVVSSTADVEAWGPADSNHVDVWSRDGRVRRVMTRVDVRRLDSRFGAALLEFVRTAGALLIRDDGLVVEPIIAAYAGALRSSDAWRFANDPAAFLASHSATDDDE